MLRYTKSVEKGFFMQGAGLSRLAFIDHFAIEKLTIFMWLG